MTDDDDDGTDDGTDPNISKNSFELCSYIQKNTQNPNPIFKIMIHYAKYTKNAKIHSRCWKQLEKSIKLKTRIFQKKTISKLSAFYGDFYGPPLAGIRF